MNETFEIESMKNFKFRVAKISPIDLMAISYVVNLGDFNSNRELMKFCLENVEVLVGEKWISVKTKDREIYQPLGIEKNFNALNEIFVWMLENVIGKTFTKSSESTENTQSE